MQQNMKVKTTLFPKLNTEQSLRIDNIHLSLYLVMASLPCKLRTKISFVPLSSTTPLGLLVGGLSLTSHTNFPSLLNTHSLWFLLSATMMFPAVSTTNPAGSESSPGPDPELPKTFVLTVFGSRM